MGSDVAESEWTLRVIPLGDFLQVVERESVV